MREIIVDQARRRRAHKRGGDRKGRSLNDELLPFEHEPDEVLALHEVLSEFERIHPRKAHVVTMHSFAGLQQSEIARALGLSIGTVERDWRFAKAWLRRKMAADASVLEDGTP
jgi:RNA polymerase sigma factor (TIGR02999 family)